MKKNTVQVKGGFKNNLLLFLGIMAFFCFSGTAQTAQPPQPPPRFQEVEGSSGFIVRDNNTGLEWQRCPHGQRWTGARCIGSAWLGNWYDAIRVTASGGFRIPTIDELKTLAPYDQKTFPGDCCFWSSSPTAVYADYVWYLVFNRGHVSGASKNGHGQLRLVRSGQ